MTLRRRIEILEGKLSPPAQLDVPACLEGDFEAFLSAELGEAEARKLHAKVVSAVGSAPFTARLFRAMTTPELDSLQRCLERLK